MNGLQGGSGTNAGGQNSTAGDEPTEKDKGIYMVMGTTILMALLGLK